MLQERHACGVENGRALPQNPQINDLTRPDVNLLPRRGHKSARREPQTRTARPAESPELWAFRPKRERRPRAALSLRFAKPRQPEI